MLGMAILLGFYFLGFIMHDALHVPLPANVLGLMLFTAALFAKVIKLEWVEQSSQFLIRHMMLFFAPVIVGTLVFSSIIGSNWLSTVIGLVFSTLVVLWVTGRVTEVLRRKEAAGEAD